MVVKKRKAGHKFITDAIDRDLTRALFEYSPIETIMVDRDGRVTMFNLAKKESGDRLPKIGDVMYKDYAAKHEIDMHGELMKCIRSGKLKEFPVQRYGKRFLSITIAPFPKGAIITSRDITVEKSLQKKLIHSERMAEIGQLAAGIAHEFNNLLNIIGGTAQYAQGIKDEKEIRETLDIITKSSNRGADVVKNLLSFARRIEFKKESVNIVEVIEEVLNLVKRDLENSSIEITRNYSDVPKTVLDIGQMQQVFLNLITNARYAMSRGGRLSINLDRDENFIKMQFHNTGKTIRKEDLPRLFTPFFTTRTKQRKGIIGTGLGLSISHDIIEGHGGEISVKSERGKGTTFTIRLPIIEEKMAAAEKRDIEAAQEKGIERKKANILVVDDESDICELFKKVLTKEGYSVTIANDGKSALSLYKKNYFDIIYMDIVMPKMDGIAASKKILKITPDARIVFMSGKPIEDKAVLMSFDSGVMDFLRKPIPIDELIRHTQFAILKER